MTEKLMNWSVATLGANCQTINQAVTNFFLRFLAVAPQKVLMQVAANSLYELNKINFSQNFLFCRILMFNWIFVAFKQSVIGCVDSVWSTLLQRSEMSLFSTFCAALGSNVGKSCQHVEKHFSSILKHLLNIVNVFTMDWVTLQMHLEPLSTRCNALSTHWKCIENANNAIFIKPGFPK